MRKYVFKLKYLPLQEISIPSLKQIFAVLIHIANANRAISSAMNGLVDIQMEHISTLEFSLSKSYID